ncbi:MAG: hypothetical protein K0S33_2083 [Bacteroidetes bacterium]|jgi:hypothetical protein|nr:hypothetical protein [Bacteroidota bacterium]
MNLIITLFATAVYLLAPSTYQGQQHSTSRMHNIISNPGEMAWKTEYENTQVLIESSRIVYTSPGNTTNHERVVFRYTNRTNGNLKLSFGRKMMYNGVCYGCDKTDKKFTIVLSAQQSKEFSTENKDKTFYIFSKDLKNTITKTLDSFELTNIETTVQ